MFFKPDLSLIQKGDFDISDLEEDNMILIQNKYYPLFTLFFWIYIPYFSSWIIMG